MQISFFFLRGDDKAKYCNRMCAKAVLDDPLEVRNILIISSASPVKARVLQLLYSTPTIAYKYAVRTRGHIEYITPLHP